MSDWNSDVFDTQATPDELTTGDTHLSGRLIENAQAVRDRCDNGECQNPVPHPMEAAWIELASPVPKTDALHINYNNPEIEKVGNSLAIGIEYAMRPNGIAYHSLAYVREGWKGSPPSVSTVCPALSTPGSPSSLKAGKARTSTSSRSRSSTLARP